MATKKSRAKMPARKVPRAKNPFLADQNHMGKMTVRQLVELVGTAEFPKGLDTRICIGDVEGNLGVNDTILVTAHKPGDIVLSVDMNEGDMGYCNELVQEG